MARQAKSNRKASPTRRQTEPDLRHLEAASDQTDELKESTMKTSSTIDETAAHGADYARKSYDQFAGVTREQLEKASAGAFKAYQELSQFQKDNYEAYVKASTIFAKGAENVGKAWFAFTQDSLEDVAQTAKALLGAKTLREAVDLQNEWAKSNLDKLMAEGTKLSELTVKVTNEALAPLNARVNVAVEKFLKPVATV